MSKHTSIELSKRLKELGLDDGTSEEVWVTVQGKTFVCMRVGTSLQNIIAPAYQFHEVMRLIRPALDGYDLHIVKRPRFIEAGYMCKKRWLHWFGQASSVEAIGLLLEWERRRR